VNNVNVILADPFLEGVAGHHYSYLRSIQTELASRQLNSKIIGNVQSIDSFSSSEVLPHFGTTRPAKRKRKNSVFEKIRSIFSSQNIGAARISKN